MAVETIPSLIPLLGAPDYHDWLALINIAPYEEKKAKFERDIVPHLNDYAEGSVLTNFAEANPWVREFHQPDSRFERTLHDFEEHPNETTIALAEYIKHLAGTIITVQWQQNMRNFVQRVSDGWDGSNEEMMTETIGAFEQAVPKLVDAPVWRVLCAQMRIFSLRVGCPSPYQDPLDCVTGVRTQVASHNARQNGQHLVAPRAPDSVEDSRVQEHDPDLPSLAAAEQTSSPRHDGPTFKVSLNALDLLDFLRATPVQTMVDYTTVLNYSPGLPKTLEIPTEMCASLIRYLHERRRNAI